MIRIVAVVVLSLSLVACGGMSPTATPAFARYKASDVVDALTPVGVTDVKDGVRSPSEPWPNVHDEWKLFAFAGIATDKRGGQILTYTTAQNMAAMQAYLDRLPADLKVYSYTNHNALLFLANTMPAAESAKLRDAFMAMK